MSGDSPAFPSPTGNPLQDGSITKRELFALGALMGIISSSKSVAQTEGEDQVKAEIRYALTLADALLTALGSR